MFKTHGSGTRKLVRWRWFPICCVALIPREVDQSYLPYHVAAGKESETPKPLTGGRSSTEDCQRVTLNDVLGAVGLSGRRRALLCGAPNVARRAQVVMHTPACCRPKTVADPKPCSCLGFKVQCIGREGTMAY
ncbi:hypothetical protein GGR57DRAFT_388183 [Xylariaceae sp. FL1272]|nr:hypothetical protein GGR57DRAFT_388183 [Xylariaceae sp. FL1272]